MVYLENINLQGFRNYDGESWSPGRGVNLITGDNAQGKTNLLEAIYLGTSPGSFRTNRVNEVINWSMQKSALNYKYFAGGNYQSLSIKINSDGKKEINFNGKNVHYSKIYPALSAIVFTPEDLEIVKGSPSYRRKFLDLELGKLDAFYNYYLRQYQKILFERNNLIRDIAGKQKNRELLGVWDDQLAGVGSIVLTRRFNLLKKFAPLVRKVFQQLTGDREELDIKYLCSVDTGEDSSKESLEERFLKELTEISDKEVYRGQTLKGPHRDDVVIYINNMNSRQYASRGQQRTVVLAFKIALMRLWEQEYGEYPVLLMDDVLQELDITRQELLFSEIYNKIQSFIVTSMKKEKIITGEIVDQYVDIENGKIYREG